MTAPASVPFVVCRENGVVRGFSVMATREVSHGLLRLEGDRLVAQWSTARETSRAGWEIRVDHEQGPVRELELPLSRMAGARVRWRLLPWPPRWQIVLRAADLRAFEGLARELQLPLSHPAELVLDLRAADRAVAREFAADLSLTLAEEAVRLAEVEQRSVAALTSPTLPAGATGPATPVPRWRAG
jgi:hypothetical protein